MRCPLGFLAVDSRGGNNVLDIDSQQMPTSAATNSFCFGHA